MFTEERLRTISPAPSSMMTYSVRSPPRPASSAKAPHRVLSFLFVCAIINFAIISCNDNKITNEDPNNYNEDPWGRPDGYTQVNLVADTTFPIPPRHIDIRLVNAWGIVVTGDECRKIYVASNFQGKVLVYDTAGNEKESQIIIPLVLMMKTTDCSAI